MLFIVLFFNNKSLRWMALRRSHFQCGKCEGRRSQSSVARTPSLALPPRWARKEFCVVVCAALLTFVCMLRYWMWNVVPIWFLYSLIFMVQRYADLVPVFFDIYSGTLGRSGPVFFDIYSDTLGRSHFCILRCLQWYTSPIWSRGFFGTYRNILYQSGISGQDAQSASVPRMFFSVGWKCQPEEGGIGPGCCGGGVITTWAARDGVIAAGSAV